MIKRKATQTFFLVLLTTYSFSQSFSPEQLSNLSLWLRSDSALTITPASNPPTVQQWNDLSGNGFHADQSVIAKRPQVIYPSLIGSKPALVFDGVSYFLNGSTVTGLETSSYSLFMLVKGNPTAQIGGKGIFTIGNAGSGLIIAHGNNSLTYRNGTAAGYTTGNLPVAGFPYTLIEIIKSYNSSVEFYFNGALISSSTTAGLTGSFANTLYKLGVNGTTYLNGEMAEIVLYKQALNTTDRQNVENYIYNHYASPVSLGPDINQTFSLCPVTLSAGQGYVSYQWSNGATTSSITALTSGSYSVTVTDVFNRTSSDTIDVTLPKPVLNYSDTTICLGASLNIKSSLSDSAGYTFLWQNSSSTPALNTSVPGSYYVSVSDGTCSATSDTLTLMVDSLSAGLSLGADTQVCAGSPIGLFSPTTNLSSLSFLWSTNSTDSTIAINNTGTYWVSVTNVNSCSAIDTIMVNVSGSSPVADFPNDTLCLGATYYAQNNSFSTDTSTIASYLWTFDGTATSNLAQPSFLFASPGTHTVELTITSTSSCSAYKSGSVLINHTPNSLFVTDTSCINVQANFADLSSVPSPDQITQWNWAFGDGGTSSQQNPSYTYTVANTYNVRLIVTTNQNCSDTNTLSSVIVASAPQPMPVNLLTPTNNISLSNNLVQFTWQITQVAPRYSVVIATNPSFLSPSTYNAGNNSGFSLNLPANQTYYWKVRSYNQCNDSVETASRKFTLFKPDGLANLALWLRADTGITISAGGGVSQWNDISGGGYNVTQASSNFQPTISTPALINSKPSVVFDGSNDALNGAAGVNIAGVDTTSYSFFVLAKGNPTTQTGGKGIFTIGTAGTGLIIAHGNNSLTYRNSSASGFTSGNLPIAGFPYTLIEIVKTYGVNVKFYFNGVLADSVTTAGLTSSFTNGQFKLGVNGTTYLVGEIAELLLYTRALSASERRSVENYIFDRYAPPVNLGPDVAQAYSLCPVVLNAQDRFTNYAWSTGESAYQINAKVSGTYWVVATDVFNRVSTDTVIISVPYAGMNIPDTTICSYQSLTIQPLLANSYPSYVWNTGATTLSINTAAPGDYVVSITDLGGCVFVGDTVTVEVDSIAAFNLITPTDTTLCAGNELRLNPINYPSPVIAWSHGPDSMQIPFNTAGSYTVQVTDANGCSVADAVNVDISWIAPAINFTAATACFGDTTSFFDATQNVPPDNVKTWNWVFGDGQTSNVKDPEHYYFAPGDYNVTLSIVTDSGCTGILSKVVTSSVPPIPGFTYPEVICAGTQVLLTDQSAFLFGDSVTAWAWSVNGVTASTAKNFAYEFTAQGSYDITLRAISKSGCSDSITETIDVFPTLKADFAYKDVCFGDSTSFTDLTGSLSIVDWQWTLGYSISAVETEQNPKHKYAAPGDYTVTLRVENAIGCVDYETKTVSVVQRPTAKFGNLIACEDQAYTPLDSSIVNNDTIAAWRWTMAGNSYNGQAPTHIFPDSGSYPVKLKVTTQKGCSDSVTRTVSVKPTPKALFSATPLYGEAPVEISFINQSTGASSYLWNFGDASISTDAAPFHTYTANDTFNITLTATSTFGCMDSSSRTFIVAPTDLDIAVDKVTVTKKPQPDGSYLINVVADVSNVGTRLITNTLFYVTIGSGGVIAEEWDSVILSGYNAQVVFKAEFVVAAENANSYVCVKAVSVNNGETEMRTDNNSQCASTEQTIQVIGPSPNPMSSNASVGIIVPKAGTVTIDIMDMAGQYVVKGEQVNVPKGRSEWQLPADKMRSAEYFLRLYYNDDIIIRKFIVAKQ